MNPAETNQNHCHHAEQLSDLLMKSTWKGSSADDMYRPADAELDLCVLAGNDQQNHTGSCCSNDVTDTHCSKHETTPTLLTFVTFHIGFICL